MTVRLLGPVSLEAGGVRLPIRSRATRSLLACLALRAGSYVSADELTTWVWGDDDLPENPVPALQTVVSRLRRTLRDAGTPLTVETGSGGYVLRVPPDQVDVQLFESRVRQARELAKGGDHERAVGLLDDALALWTDVQALVDVTPSLAATGEAARLAELRLNTLHDRIELLLALRPPREQVADLARLTSQHPLREGFARLYMVALEACGRRAEALEVYRRLAHTMNEELGVSPGPEVRGLHAALLTDRPPPARGDGAAAEASRPTRPVRVGTPPALAAAFQRRADLRARIDAALAGRAGTVVVTQVMAGDGGTGKTQLAAHLFYDAMDSGDLDLAVWVTATSRDAVLAGYAAAHDAVRPTGPDLPDNEDRAAAFLAWLAATDRTWLIVLDDVADPADLSRLRPHGPTGRVLVTTRRRDAAMTAIGSLVDVGVFTPAESLAYLQERLHRPGLPADVLDGAAQLAADLGHLPLALAQAGAVIINDAISCAEYRALLADRTLTLAELFPADPRTSGDDYAHALPAAWSLATERAAAVDPLVPAVLRLVAALDPNGVPEAVLLAPLACEYLGAGQVISPREARSAIRAAHRFSLLTHTPAETTRSVRMHALAQRATLDQLTEQELARVVLAAADALLEAYPREAVSAELSEVMRVNSVTLAGRQPDILRLPYPHPIILRAALDLGQVGQVHRDVEYFAQLVARKSASLGADHPSTLDARMELAAARVRAGDAAGAVRGFEALLADQLRVLGPDRRDTLATRYELACARGEAGDAAAAHRELVELTDTCTRVLGPEEPLTLAVRINRGHWQIESGDHRGAVRAFEELLPELVRTGGTDGIGALYARNYLARARGLAGDPRAAVEELTALVDYILRTFGRPASPATLEFRLALAHWQGRAGELDTALAGLEALLADHLRVLGADHPDTLLVRHELAHWRGVGGDVEAAVAEYRSLLADLERVLGPEHLRTVRARDALAVLELTAAEAKAEAGGQPAR